jgi:hypothetical protein
MFWWLAIACQTGPETVVLEGRLLDGHDSETPLVGATLRIRDVAGDVFGEAVTDGSGAYRVDAPGGQTVFAEISSDGYTNASFNGVAGMNPLQGVPDGLLFGISDAEDAIWRALFDGCEGADGDGAAVYGDVRLSGYVDEESGEFPIITSGFVAIEADEQIYDACYLGEDGLEWDPEATETGASGRFAIFGLPAGVHAMEVGYDVYAGNLQIHPYALWLPDGGVSPRFPAFVELASEPGF